MQDGTTESKPLTVPKKPKLAFQQGPWQAIRLPRPQESASHLKPLRTFL
jgi:hypothetical protein